MSKIDYLLKFYKTTLDTVEPSVLDTIFKGDWNTRQSRPVYDVSWQKEKYVDNHPTPSEYLEYLQTIISDIEFNESTLKFVEQSNQQVLSKDFTTSTFKFHCAGRLGVDYE
jgi:hypothetical protein